MDEATPLELQLAQLLSRRRANSTLRTLTLPTPNQTDFSSNDFLSLSSNKVIKQAYLQELEKQDLPLGSGGSRLLDGNSLYAETLEKDIATFHNAKAGLLFNSGFDANAGFFACVPQPGDIILYDALIHASVHDGMRLSRAASTIPFAHNCLRSLRSQLTALLSQSEHDLGERLRQGKAHVFVAVEAVYSMDGDVAPLRGIVEVVEEVLPRGTGYVVVDEAHATGVLGPMGRGLVCEEGLEGRVFARLHTFGKGVGCNGGMCLSSIFSLPSPLIPVSPKIFICMGEKLYGILGRGESANIRSSHHPQQPNPTIVPPQLRPPSNLHNLPALPLPRRNPHSLHIPTIPTPAPSTITPPIPNLHLLQSPNHPATNPPLAPLDHPRTMSTEPHLLYPTARAEGPRGFSAEARHDGEGCGAADCA